jgi:hypothetical protein
MAEDSVTPGVSAHFFGDHGASGNAILVADRNGHVTVRIEGLADRHDRSHAFTVKQSQQPAFDQYQTLHPTFQGCPMVQFRHSSAATFQESLYPLLP